MQNKKSVQYSQHEPELLALYGQLQFPNWAKRIVVCSGSSAIESYSD